ncbi:MAG: 5-formyltetrahydrofolate cyclo-ligase [Fibrobacteres bacterium]|nr:5-formyltetrahydrofolate cyclo-ligase [Fibrobacterota bacterium]
MDSIGAGEILVIALVSLLALDPRQAGRWWGKFRQFQARLLSYKDGLEREIRENVGEAVATPVEETSQSRLRNWARERVGVMEPMSEREVTDRLLSHLRAWDVYRCSSDVALFWSIGREIPMESVLEGVISDGKRIWLPWLDSEPGIMDLAHVADLGTDLVPGRWGTREPAPARRGGWFPEGGIVLVPGEVFDLAGGRIGKGAGYYDRWLALNPKTIRVGVAWETQVHPGKLPQQEHDQPMGHLLTPERFVHVG